jgi:hypothetical protein
MADSNRSLQRVDGDQQQDNPTRDDGSRDEVCALVSLAQRRLLGTAVSEAGTGARRGDLEGFGNGSLNEDYYKCQWVRYGVKSTPSRRSRAEQPLTPAAKPRAPAPAIIHTTRTARPACVVLLPHRPATPTPTGHFCKKYGGRSK